MFSPIRSRLRSEDGFTLVEMLAASILLVIAVIGTFTALEAVGRAGVQERYRLQAYSAAQDDQARLRGLKVTQLIGLSQTRNVSIDGINFTVKSSSRVITDSTGTQSCDQGTAAADYMTITSTVSWPNMTVKPIAITSIVTPPTGTFDESTGTLAVAVQDSRGVGIPNIGLSGSGAGSFSGVTGDNGCAIFAALPEGNYTLTSSASDYVDKDGNPAGSQPTSVVAQSTNTVALQLDRPGSVDVRFQTLIGGKLQATRADSITVFNTGMTNAESFGTIGNPVSQITASPLFPFTSPDTVYAGNCTGNNPGTTAPAAAANVTIPRGASASPVTVTLPSLNLTVWKGTSTSPGSAASNARVTITDANGCNDGASPVKRVLTTNSSGKLDEPGMPFGTYTICVSGPNSSGSTRRVTTSNVNVKSTTTPTPLTVYLGSSATTGNCP
jgi:hypothetical protein